jgi:predicted outer membrane repeat protein
MTVQRSRFVDNAIAGGGGVAYVIENSVLNVSDTIMTGNNATDGGALYVSSSTLQLNNCTISKNHAAQTGGAVYSAYSNVTATGTTIKGNSAFVGGGWSASNDKLTLAGCDFVANAARSGGALHMLLGCSANATNTRFVDNSALMTGGAVVSATGSNASLIGCTFTRNSATISGGSGGALHLGRGNEITATATWFEGNNATYGGAIASTCTNVVGLLDCQLVGNAATDVGGALHIADGSLDVCPANDVRTSLTASMCSFQRNTARTGGGAAYVANGAEINFLSSEFVLNHVGSGKGGAVLLRKNSSCGCSNTSFRGNTAMQGGAVAVTQLSQASFSGGCLFSSNDGVEGGALAVDGARVVLEDSTLRRNLARQGGGLVARNVAEVTLGPGVNMVGNAARLFGGGMLVDFECSQQVRLESQVG